MTIVLSKLKQQTEPAVAELPGRELNHLETAKPVKRILDQSTGEVVGWLYQWNTGGLAPMWKDGACKDYIIE